MRKPVAQRTKSTSEILFCFLLKTKKRPALIYTDDDKDYKRLEQMSSLYKEEMLRASHRALRAA